LEKCYAFEVIYDDVKNPLIDKIIKSKNKVEFIKYAIIDRDDETEFFFNKKGPSGSQLVNFSTKNNKNVMESYKVKTTSIDNLLRKNDLKKPDLIKSDIEGAELFALKGAIETIKKYRPQLAFSIYHSDNDFVEIPLWLSKNLENYVYRIGHYYFKPRETVFYAIPKELA